MGVVKELIIKNVRRIHINIPKICQDHLIRFPSYKDHIGNEYFQYFRLVRRKKAIYLKATSILNTFNVDVGDAMSPPGFINTNRYL